MGETRNSRNRRTYIWPKEAADFVNANRTATSAELSSLVTTLARLSGNPRYACWRFVRKLGVRAKTRNYRRWSKPEQEKLLRLVESHSIRQAALMLQRTGDAVRAMLKRLGASATMGKDWFTKYSLAQALRVRPEKVQQWIDSERLKTRLQENGSVKHVVIDADEFCRFCKEHRREVIGRRLNQERLDFIQTFVFPPSHAELLPVRESKKERAAYSARLSSTENESIDSDSGETLDCAAHGIGSAWE